MVKNLTKKIYIVTTTKRKENWTLKVKLLKENPLKKDAVMAMSLHEIAFHLSVSTSPFCFHAYFGRPSELILIVSAIVEKLAE